jgi:transcriptional regulator with XRE-family HTH domain
MRWPKAVTKAREMRGISQKDVGAAMSISHVAVGSRERGSTVITGDWLNRFLAVISMNREEFFNLVERVPVHSLAPSEDIPLFPNLASAGKRAFVPDDIGEEWNETVQRGTATCHPQAFAVKIHGDSMSPMILHDDIVVCEPVSDEDGQGSLSDGRIVIVWGGGVSSTNDYSIVDGDVKHKGKQSIVPDGGMIGRWTWAEGGAGELRKTNQSYQPVRLPAEHNGTVRIAVVVEIRRRV